MVSHSVGVWKSVVLTTRTAVKILSPHLEDGVYEWRDGKRYVKEGDRLYLEGTNTLAGRHAHFLSLISHPIPFPLPPLSCSCSSHS